MGREAGGERAGGERAGAKVESPGELRAVADRLAIGLVARLSAFLFILTVLAIGAFAAFARPFLRDHLAVLLVLVVHHAFIFGLNRTRYHRVAGFLFCLAPLWSNGIAGLISPADPVWFAFVPLAVILATVLLGVRPATLIGALGVVMVAAVLTRPGRGADAAPAVLVIGYEILVSGVTIGMARFRARVEAARMTEVERLSAQLAATERLEAIGRMAGGVAHDFNNLLTVIMTSAVLVRRGHAGALEEIESAAQRAAALTKQLLAFSHNRAASAAVVGLDEAVEAMRPLLRRLVPDEIELVFDLGCGWPIVIDESQLQQILLNLVANARDAMPSGGRLRVATSTVRYPRDVAAPRGAGEHAILTIEDQGAGMDAATLEHAFEPFFTTKPIGHGTGLGLATVHGIVRQRGGWVELASQPGAGTRVTIALARSPAPAPSATIGRPVRAATGGRRPNGLTLLVEDDPLVRRATCLALEDLGLEVVTAASAAEVARALAEAGRPIDLLVTDVVMPGASGLDVAAELRRTRPDLAVLLMSGYAEDDVGPVLAQPRTRFLPKPFTPSALAAAVEELLGDVASAVGARPAS